MFSGLGTRLTDIFKRLQGRGVLTEETITSVLREIRVALLEADVSVPVAKHFIEDVTQRAVGAEILKSVTPAQTVIKIVHDALVDLLSEQQPHASDLSGSVIMLVGLQGSGKTTMTAKLAHLFQKKGKKVLMVSLDTARPGAQRQLEVLGQQIQAATLPIEEGQAPYDIARRALAQKKSADILLFDTAGRLHKDEALMAELVQLKKILTPSEILFVADALLGQDAVRTGKAFHDTLSLTGVALSRIDGDSRGGAALSLKHVIGCPLKVMGTGEKPSEVELFDPQRIARRILDMGDIVDFVEKATEMASQEDQEKALARLQKGVFTLHDLAKTLEQLEKMGGMQSIFQWLPGMRDLKAQLGDRLEKASFKAQKAILSSMTKQEKAQPELLNGSRKRRIAEGSGTSVQEVNRLLKQFEQMQGAVKKMKGIRGFLRS